MNTLQWKPARRLVSRQRHGLRRWHGAVPVEAHHRATHVGLGLAVTGATLAAYRLAFCPWHRQWGATEEDVQRVLPGDALVPDARYRTTRALTIDAPVGDVWPWLAQIGQGRGGFYSYARLERLVGAEIYNADEVHPEWQDLHVGEEIRLAPEGAFNGKAKMTVSVFEPGRALVFGPPPPEQEGAGSWAFVLEPIDAHTTRLLVRTQGQTAHVPPFFFLFDFIHFIMERKMMLGIKQRAEKHVRLANQAEEAPVPVT